MTNKKLTQRVVSHPITKKATQLTKKGIKLKLYETLITGLVFSTYIALPLNYINKKSSKQNSYQTPPIIRDESQERLQEHIENQLKPREEKYS